MIEPRQFYTPNDLPPPASKKRMWQGIKREISPRRASLLFIADRRSFAYGMAAMVLLYLATVGGVTVVKQLVERAQPAELKVDGAYESAISAFERVMPSVVATASKTPPEPGRLASRQEQLRLLDAAISDLRRQTNGVDLSPLTRERLRQLYSIKLQILQQMIEQGEIEL
jgi:hypothetical protein